MKDDEVEYLYVPALADFFKRKRKNEALIWIPVQCSLLFSNELQNLCTATKYIFIALLLICGNRGTNELPFNISYLARMAGVNRRTMSKGIEDLLCAKMLNKRERETAEKEKREENNTDEPRVAESPDAPNDGAVVRVDFKNSSQTADRDARENGFAEKNPRAVANDALSAFGLKDCLRYVEHCRARGDPIKNPQGLAIHLHQTGKSDAFIRAALYPENQREIDRQTFGEPRRFTDEPCAVCFGAKMADADGKGYRKCAHCRNERGKATGFEPAN